MKTNYLLLFFVTATLTLTTSCKKNKTGDLKVNVIDGTGNSIGSGKTVFLYQGLSDYNNALYSESAITNSSGQVEFLELEPGDYYADCDWENQLGFIVTSSGSGSVDKKMVTTITIAP